MAKQVITEVVLKGMTDPSLKKAFKNAQKLADSNLDVFHNIGETAKKVGKMGAVAIGATATAIAGLGKASIESYAEYEQLVGGVETLFKDSSGKLIQYANEAYKTAGISANDYMSTITSFSASMINSLGGDTAKATEYSNQAVIDMADNANKMGTDMESIMNTYQSMARGQFGMLDNLKLGYGGTKAEMERLLADAEKLTGMEYDISNFADITQAIHAIQENIGITGTTAEEASSTIQGSWLALKSSWANLMTGLADPNQDLGDLISKVFDSALTFFEGNLMPRIKEVLPRIATAISEFTPLIIDVVTSLVPLLIPVAIDGAVSIVKALVSSLPEIFSALTSALPSQVVVLAGVIAGAFAGVKILAFVKGIISVIKVVKVMTSTFGVAKVALAALGGPVTIIIAVVGALIGIFVALWVKCKPFKEFFTKTIPNAIKSAKTAIVNFFTNTIPTAFNKAITFLKQLPSKIWNFLVMVVTKIIQFRAMMIQKAIEIGSKFLTAIVNFFKQLPYKIGYVIGFVIGKVIQFGQRLWTFATTTIPQFITKVIEWFKTLPSRIWTWLTNTIQKIVAWGARILSLGKQKALQFVTSVVNFIKTLPSKVWTWLSNTAQKVVSWGTNLAAKGKAAAKKLLTAIVNKVKEIPGKMISIGKDIVKGIWNGIGNSKDWLIGKVKSFASGITDGIKNALGINSPSIVMEKLFKWVPVGAGEGILNNAKYAIDAVKSMGGKIAQTASNIVPTVTAKVNPVAGKFNGNGASGQSGSIIKSSGASAGKAVGGSSYSITFAPVVSGGSTEENKQMLEDEFIKFRNMLDQYFAEKERLAY